MALKQDEKSVSSCSTENSAPPSSQMRYRSRPTDNLAEDYLDDRVTAKSRPLTGAYNVIGYAPNNAANVVSNEIFCLLEDSITPNTKELNDRLMKFLLPPKWIEYQAMAGDIAVASIPGDSPESESSTISLEHAGAVHVLINGHDDNISPGSEQLKVGIYSNQDT